MTFSKKTIKDVEITEGMSVLLRADFNVPLKEGKIADEFRIKQTLPTIKYILKKRAKLIIISHLGRPDGKPDLAFSLAPVADFLKKELENPVVFVDDIVGDKAKQAVETMDSSTVLLLENLRFDPREESNSSEFAKELAVYGELFIQDGFGVVHRAHASTVAITKELPSVAGLLLEKEVTQITKAMTKPKRPLLAVIGGAKISDKIEIINKFIEIADSVAVGGAMANTFLKASGMKVGSSIVENDALDTAKEIIELAEEKAKETDFTFYLPQDGVVATEMETIQPTRIVDWGSQSIADIQSFPAKADPRSYEIQTNEMILDIGPISAAYIAGLSRNSKTVIWNGTLGFTEAKARGGEIGPFEHGSHTLLKELDKNHAPKQQFSLIGGGDTASYVLGVDGIGAPDHVSTGGGASLELMAGKKLPGVEVLENK